MRACSQEAQCLVLSRGEESALLGHLVSVLAIGRDGKGHGCNAKDDGAHDGGVGLPVGGLSVPTTGRRPDVLGETGLSVSAGNVQVVDWWIGPWKQKRILNLATATHVVRERRRVYGN